MTRLATAYGPQTERMVGDHLDAKAREIVPADPTVRPFGVKIQSRVREVPIQKPLDKPSLIVFLKLSCHWQCS